MTRQKINDFAAVKKRTKTDDKLLILSKRMPMFLPELCIVRLLDLSEIVLSAEYVVDICVYINYMIHISVHDFSICALRNRRQQQQPIIIITKPMQPISILKW